MEPAKRIRYPVSQSSFEVIRDLDYIYVDKTEYIFRLVDEPGFYFISRPRRFGKTLMLSTLEAFYSGKRHLFKGLALDALIPGEWEEFPVLRMSLTGQSYLKSEDLMVKLDSYISRWEKKYCVSTSGKTIEVRFRNVIEAAAETTGKRVVVLIDEYDAPLVATIDNPELQGWFRDLLHGFYSVLKEEDARIQFCMLTGVTKFGKISVFSGLNNLRDITFSNDFAGICGITDEELHDVLAPGVEELARDNEWTTDEAYRRLKLSYDGYHFSRRMLDVYNPYSLINCLVEKQIADYWCNSGMPTVLVKILQQRDFDLKKINGTMVTFRYLNNISVYRPDPVALFYQTGYLTIKSYDREEDVIMLGYPNREVEQGVLSNVLETYLPDSPPSNFFIKQLKESLTEGKPERFVELMKAFISSIPSKLSVRVSKYENYFHTIFYCVASLIGLDLKAEYNTSAGFIDMLIETADYIYVIELKVNGDAEDAIRQIEDKGYCNPFVADRRRIFRIGIGFSSDSRELTSSLIV